ncbi:hypothetical protein HJG60_010090 [Phyllostomus discolor]|uniref:Uncharacterized protein n=1 Tax=Phyllostomus discolor TaxID=89673 RepID=A0A834AW44_9CHIR|nr:hypothetical protein HJG60_010090 [Phyllostomus discolor]
MGSSWWDRRQLLCKALIFSRTRSLEVDISRAHDRMEDFTEAKPLDTGPLYFFDQMKPERKKQGRRECKEHFLHLEYTSGVRDSPTKSMTSEEAEKEEAALDKYAFYSFAVSQTPVIPKFPTGLKFSKIYLQKSLFEEYKLTAAEILCELGETLQKYAEYNITFPVGTVNLVNYSWHDLIEGAYKCPTKKSMLKKHNALRRDRDYVTTTDKISSCSNKECHKDNHLVKIKKDHHHTTSSKSTEKSSLVSQTQCSQICQDRSLPDAIHFSLSSTIGLENGWIFQNPFSLLEILKCKTVLDAAVKRLQGAIIQIKTEEDKLKKEGLSHQLILRHYNDPEGDVETLVGRASPPAVCWNGLTWQCWVPMDNFGFQ